MDVVALIDALAALRRNDTTAALQLLDGVAVAIDDDPQARMVKAELLLAQGNAAKALDVVRDGFLCPCSTRVLMTLMRGRIAEAAGERELAIDSYAFVTRVWRKADPEAQRFVEQARAGLKRLGADERTVLKL